MTAETHPPGSDRSADLHWSARAIELAAQADYRTSPNPMVGAVVLDREGHIAGEGFHKGHGQPHAEQEALAQAGERAKGALHPHPSHPQLRRRRDRVRHLQNRHLNDRPG
jgi:tRNA(Arg) A34 adenosine deaminase TadA